MNTSSTATYDLFQGFRPDTSLSINSKIECLIESIGFTFTDILDSDGKKVSALISAIFNNSSETIKQTEKRIRELLMDHHVTFPLFSKWIDVAWRRALAWEKVSVELYIRDISHPDFLNTLETLKIKWIDPSLLIIEIRADDCGIIDSKVIKNLQKMDSLWFRFSLNDFVVVGDEIRVNHLEKITKAGRLPLYIRIAKHVFEKILWWIFKKEKNALEHKQGFWGRKEPILELLISMMKKGVKILQGEPTVSHEMPEDKTKPSLSFLNNSEIKKEGIFNIYGECYAKECLFRPWDGMKVPQALEILMLENMTWELMCRQINGAIEDILRWEKISVNVYIKDIWASNFRELLESKIWIIPKNKRSGLIFELLEVKYGSMNEQVLTNLRFLQESGFTIAIDDFLLWDNTTSMSKEILITLHEAWIYLDYIKIDGSIIEGIREWKLSLDEISELKQVIWENARLSRRTMFILEWIQNTDHALQLLQVLEMNSERILFQWRNINSENFGIPHSEARIDNSEVACK